MNNFRQQGARVSELDGSVDGMRIDTVGYGLWAMDLGTHLADDMTGGMAAQFESRKMFGIRSSSTRVRDVVERVSD